MSIDTTTKTLIHWNFFLALEEDLHALSRCVDFSEMNDSTFSIEIARLFLNACSELDVVLKQICKNIDPNSSAKSINAYHDIISNNFPNFKIHRISLQGYNRVFLPWLDWEQGKPPTWWSDHNLVKHHRHEYYGKANLKNCLNSLVALQIAIVHLYNDQASNGALHPNPRLLRNTLEFTKTGNGISIDTIDRYKIEFKISQPT